ncbi:MAG: hypothetical protein JHD12_20570 [Rhodococcus sp.]|nr:hypothetical protein [Rhodococcus sp. (in: high G+C Gram-positive bacteria)]
MPKAAAPAVPITELLSGAALTTSRVCSATDRSCVEALRSCAEVGSNEELK